MRDNQNMGVAAAGPGVAHEAPTSAPADAAPADAALAARLGAAAGRLAAAGAPAFALRFPDGVVRVYGESGDDGPRVLVSAATPRGARALASLDEYAITLAFLDGEVAVEGDFLDLMALRPFLSDRHPWLLLLRFAAPLLRGQVASDNRVVPRHYDHGNDFYFSFLDRRHRLYSQALYRTGRESLEEAATAKLENVWEACRLKPGARVLDIGGGWGSFAAFAAARGAEVTTLTLSDRQYRHLQGLAETTAAADGRGRIVPVLRNVYDFAADRPFDAVVLLGVMEHLPHYRRFLDHASRLVRAGGRIYMDFAANRKKYLSSTFSYRHVFEGNHSLVHMPGLVAAVNRSPFETVAILNDRHSYHLTLCAWARNLEAATGLAERFGPRVVRLFRLYLWGTARCMGDGTIESYRVVLQKSAREASVQIGLR